MKVGKIPVASIILLIFFGITLITRLFYPGQVAAETPYLDGGMIGALLVYLLYYLNIFITASANNRKEAEDNSAV